MDSVETLTSPLQSDETPLARPVGERMLVRPHTSPAQILELIARAPAGTCWFPSEYAAASGVDRDALDEPLSQLRLAELVRIETWVRGLGQGYVLTPSGQGVLASGEDIPLCDSGTRPDARAAGFIQTPDVQDVRQLPIDARTPVVVPALLIANGLWFFIGIITAVHIGHRFWHYLIAGDPSVLHQLGSVSGEDLLQGKWWRLLTCCIVHGGIVHLLANLFGLAMIGPLAELLWGRRGLLLIYVLSGLAGSCMAMTLSPEHSLVGASGAIWGVMMSVMVWFLVFRSQLPREDVSNAFRWLVLAILVNVGVSFLPGVSWQAHLGGGIAGVATSVLLSVWRLGSSSWRQVVLGLLLLVPILCIGGLGVAMGRSDRWISFRSKLDAERSQRAIAAATKSFEQEVAPRLNALSPALVNPVQWRALMQLIRPGPRRTTAIVTETQTLLNEMKALADQAIDLLSLPVGVEELDALRARSKEFAEARSRSFKLLLDMLAAEPIPDSEAWEAYGAANKQANALWLQIAKKR